MAEGIDSFIPDDDSGRQALRVQGKRHGEIRAKNDYPTYIYRDRRQIEQQAATAFQENIASKRQVNEQQLRQLQQKSDRDWKEIHKRDSHTWTWGYHSTWQQVKAEKIGEVQHPLNKWDSHVSEARQQFVTAYVTAYLEYIEKEDARRAPPPPKPVPQPQSQPTPQPATLSNTATLQGAKITFKDIERNPDEDLYIIEPVDPGHLDEPQLVYVHVGDGEPQQTASSGQTFAASFSDAVTALPSQPSYGRTGTGKVQHIYLKRKM